jgi:hypothetical protein
MKKILLLASAAGALPIALPIAFANAPKPATPGGTPAATPPATGAGSKPRVEPQITGVSTAVPMPTRTNKRGSKSSYPFESLAAVGASFGVKNKTAANLASIVSNQNRKSVEPKKDEAGNVIYKMAPLKDANGAIVGQTPTTEAETVQLRHFFAVDVDAKTDPDGASVRVFRDK